MCSIEHAVRGLTGFFVLASTGPGAGSAAVAAAPAVLATLLCASDEERSVYKVR